MKIQPKDKTELKQALELKFSMICGSEEFYKMIERFTDVAYKTDRQTYGKFLEWLNENPFKQDTLPN